MLALSRMKGYDIFGKPLLLKPINLQSQSNPHLHKTQTEYGQCLEQSQKRLLANKLSNNLSQATNLFPSALSST